MQRPLAAGAQQDQPGEIAVIALPNPHVFLSPRQVFRIGVEPNSPAFHVGSSGRINVENERIMPRHDMLFRRCQSLDLVVALQHGFKIMRRWKYAALFEVCVEMSNIGGSTTQPRRVLTRRPVALLNARRLDARTIRVRSLRFRRET